MSSARLATVVLGTAFALSGCRAFDSMDPGAAPGPHAGETQEAGLARSTDATPAIVVTSPAEQGANWDVVFSEQGDEVFFNGKRIPDQNLRREPDAIEVLGHDGIVVKRFVLPAPPTQHRPRSFLGAQLRWVSPSLASHLRLDPKLVAEVGPVLAGSPAAAAGLHEHDLIVKVDGDANASPEVIRSRLAQATPGSTIAFTLEHAGERREVLVTLAAWRLQPLPSAPIRSSAQPH